MAIIAMPVVDPDNRIVTLIKRAQVRFFLDNAINSGTIIYETYVCGSVKNDTGLFSAISNILEVVSGAGKKGNGIGDTVLPIRISTD